MFSRPGIAYSVYVGLILLNLWSMGRSLADYNIFGARFNWIGVCFTILLFYLHADREKRYRMEESSV